MLLFCPLKNQLSLNMAALSFWYRNEITRSTMPSNMNTIILPMVGEYPKVVYGKFYKHDTHDTQPDYAHKPRMNPSLPMISWVAPHNVSATDRPALYRCGSPNRRSIHWWRLSQKYNCGDVEIYRIFGHIDWPGQVCGGMPLWLQLWPEQCIPRHRSIGECRQ